MDDKLMVRFDRIAAYCFDLFKAKQKDYGPTWLLFRRSSLNDEIWRKAKRIRTLEEQEGPSSIPEGRDAEYVGIINYCIMFLIRLAELPGIPSEEAAVEDIRLVDQVDTELLLSTYEKIVAEVRDLLGRKNRDYGGAWQSMALHSMTDQILIRSYRIKTILQNGGQSDASEGIAANLHDMINYSIFALIKMDTDMIDLHV